MSIPSTCWPPRGFCCIYLDGLSEHLHGNPKTAERDREIRTWLRNHGCEVIEIPANELDDEDAMVRHFRRLASYPGMRDVRSRVRDDRSWFRGGAEQDVGAERRRLRLVTPPAATGLIPAGRRRRSGPRRAAVGASRSLESAAISGAMHRRGRSWPIIRGLGVKAKRPCAY